MVHGDQSALLSDCNAMVPVFSYGSNSTVQLRERVGRSGPFTMQPAVLPGHVRIFAGHSARWGGAVASVHPSGDGMVVEGLVVYLTQAELSILDTYEGKYLGGAAAEVTGEGA